MRLTVCIPTHRRPDALAQCLTALSRQTLPRDHYDILVGIDGPDTGEAALAHAIDPAARVQALPKAGPAATRNALLPGVASDLILWLNDDVVPDPDLLERHLEAHAPLAGPAMVLGAAPFAIAPPDRLFDRLIRETSMVFFYDQMTDAQPDRDWGYRHAWTLNLSLPTSALRAVGGFHSALRAPAYEDLECAHRLATRMHMPVLYRPEARVMHEHRYEPAGYLARERSLGREAVALAHAAPACAHDLFGRDLLDPREVPIAEAIVARLSRDAARVEGEFLHLAEVPASAIDGPHAPALLRGLYQQHLLLKRVRWHEGFLEARAAMAQAA